MGWEYAFEQANRRNKRDEKRGQASYGRNSGSGRYGSSSYGFEQAEFDGQRALKRSRDGMLEFFYGVAPGQTEVDLNDRSHGHAIIKNGKLIYKRQPGEEKPVVDRR